MPQNCASLPFTRIREAKRCGAFYDPIFFLEFFFLSSRRQLLTHADIGDAAPEYVHFGGQTAHP
jgi:hypothetical protein